MRTYFVLVVLTVKNKTKDRSFFLQGLCRKVKVKPNKHNEIAAGQQQQQQPNGGCGGHGRVHSHDDV